MARNTAEAEVVTGDVGSGLAVSGSGIHEDFARFRSEHALLKAHMPRAEVDWAYYQAGPTKDTDPVIFLHGTSGTAAAFFYQVKMLSAKGYRAISAQYPAYGTPEEWSKGFDHFLDLLKCRSAHIFGAGLGGYLAQHFASRYPHRIRSLVLCNAFSNTRPFADKAGALASVVHITPTPILRKVILDSFPQVLMTLQVKQSVDFVAGQVDEISGTDLAGRLCLNSTEGFAPSLSLEDEKITIIESSGETMVPEELRRELRRRYASARFCELKTTGDFPFLSEPEELALFVEVHMRGAGVYVGGRAPTYASGDAEAAALENTLASRPSAGYGGAPAAPRAEASYEEPPARRASRPKWINPFEDPPLPPRRSAFTEEDPLL